MRRALAFLTPIGGAAPPDAQTMRWFPATGALIGAALGGVWYLADQIWPAPVAAAIVVAADLVLTGMLHLDGLVDAADGLLPHLDRDRRLAVMREPTAGAFGIGAAVTMLLLRFAALAVMPASIPLIAGLWCASRTAMAAIALALPYARADGGLATSFLGGRWLPIALVGVVPSVALASIATGGWGAGAIGGLAATAAGLALLAFRRIGGFTGDVLGAAGFVGETVGLLIASARW